MGLNKNFCEPKHSFQNALLLRTKTHYTYPDSNVSGFFQVLNLVKKIFYLQSNDLKFIACIWSTGFKLKNDLMSIKFYKHTKMTPYAGEIH